MKRSERENQFVDAMAEEAENQIQLEVGSSGIAIITFNRPKALNALTRDMLTRLAELFQELDQRPAVKVIILTGAGRAFSAGVDLTAATAVFKGDVKNQDKDTVAQMERCRKPIIGAINGLCITAGFEIALTCDILVASTTAKFIDTHAKFGIFPSWGLSQKLSRVIGPYRARQVSLTAEPVDAQTAEKWGLVTRVVNPTELLDTAKAIAKAILKNQERMTLKYKAIINDGFRLPFGEALKLEKERAYEYYAGMKPEDFAAMQDFIAGRSSKPAKPTSKL